MGIERDYGQLLADVQARAQVLVAAGVRSGDVVAISAERGIDATVAVLAIVAAGAAYMPLDLDFPDARIGAMLDDARPRAGYGSADARARLPAGFDWIDSTLPTPIGGIEVPWQCGELAYVLFTSGSTGRPKGVAMRASAVEALIHWHRTHNRLGRPARTLQFAPLGFDVSFQEIFSTLGTGGCLVIADANERRDPFALLELIERESIERIFVPYVALQAIAEAVDVGGRVPRSLRDVVTAGEQLRITPGIRRLFARLSGAVLHNQYGPTEAHVVSAFELAGDPAAWPELPPIGAPLPHVRVRVVDADLHDLQPGASGELLLGGDCLAAGYVNRPDLDAERFVGSGEQRWYRTGDLVRQQTDGVIDYFGRIDEQIKLSGFRIEPAEIESVLCHHPMVADAVVVAGELDGIRRLLAHVVARADAPEDAALGEQLRAHCAEALPEYMVPQQFHVHALLPVTASGKVDRRALANAPSTSAPAWRERTSVHEQVLALWRWLLDAGELDVHANLFDSGARSLTVVRALTEMRGAGLVLSVAQIYEHPSVAAQVALLEGTPVAATEQLDAGARGAAQRASFARFGRRAGRQP